VGNAAIPADAKFVFHFFLLNKYPHVMALFTIKYFAIDRHFDKKGNSAVRDVSSILTSNVQ